MRRNIVFLLLLLCSKRERPDGLGRVGVADAPSQPGEASSDSHKEARQEPADGDDCVVDGGAYGLENEVEHVCLGSGI